MNDLNQAFAPFEEIAAHPAAQKEKYLAQGRKLMLCAPVFTPAELAESFGFVPFGCWGGDVRLEGAHRYFPTFICSIAQSIVELGMQGVYDGASGIMIPLLCDSLKVLEENFKYAVPQIPVLPVAWPQHRQGEAGRVYLVRMLEALAEKLSALSGRPYSPQALTEANELYRRHGRLMHRADALMAGRAVTPAQRAAVYRSAFFTDKAEHCALLEDLIAALEQAPGQVCGIPVVTCGILADSRELNRAMAESGLRVVGDNMSSQSQQYQGLEAPVALGGDPMEVLAGRFITAESSVLFDSSCFGGRAPGREGRPGTKRHIQHTVDLAQARGARGVVLFLTKFCDPEEFDAVLLRKACQAEGLPFLQVEVDRQTPVSAQILTRLQTFGEML